eukprot:TRINITY_DN3126_c0_g1_i1.p1 TRINITY_DN3126_c0_g1~~TRINITY_DN3126_c0_g1_i1.p1  ORF type:complete len:198 (-),score=47.74 TRINITY_DN3126_c0_g1_i1:62-655(-)
MRSYFGSHSLFPTNNSFNTHSNLKLHSLSNGSLKSNWFTLESNNTSYFRRGFANNDEGGNRGDLRKNARPISNGRNQNQPTRIQPRLQPKQSKYQPTQANEDNEANEANEAIETTPAAETFEVQISADGKIKTRITKLYGQVLVDIRKYYKNQTGEYTNPSMKGISLNPAQWQAFKDNIAKIDQVVAHVEANSKESE